MQLKIADVKKQVEELENKMNKKFDDLVVELSRALDGVNDNPITPSTMDTSKLEVAINTLREDLIGHIKVYNNHIIQQHSRRK